MYFGSLRSGTFRLVVSAVRGSPATSAQIRAAYLSEACGADDELRRQVDRLLKAEPKVVESPTAPQLRPVPVVRRIDRRAAADTLAQVGTRKPV